MSVTAYRVATSTIDLAKSGSNKVWAMRVDDLIAQYNVKCVKCHTTLKLNDNVIFIPIAVEGVEVNIAVPFHVRCYDS